LIFPQNLVSFQYESHRLEGDDQAIFKVRSSQRPEDNFVSKAPLNGAFLFGK